MTYEQILSLLVVTLIASIVSFVVDFILVRFNRNLVFLLPGILLGFTGLLTLFVFSGAAGWGAIILAGFIAMSAVAFIVSLIIGLLFYFKYPSHTNRP